MSDAWKSYAGAPAHGTTICALAAVGEGDTHCVDIAGFPVLLVRINGRVRAYVNACPHQFLPLDHRGDRILSADKTRLRCTNHLAGFDALTGEGVEGAAAGLCLDPIPVVIQNGSVVIQDESRA